MPCALSGTTGAPVVCRGVGTPTSGAELAWGWQHGEGTGLLHVGPDLSPSFCRDQEEPKEPRSDFAPLILPPLMLGVWGGKGLCKLLLHGFLSAF